MLGHHFTLYYYVVYVDFNTLAQLWLKHSSHHPLVGRPCILQTARHHFIVVVSNRSHECRILLDHPGLEVFDSSPERQPRSSFEDGLQLHPLTSLSEALGMGLLGTPCSSL